ncbi:MAG: response regulator [Lachnospiraceae bacterium]|nr:response regulator [Lachnospiraceae bacterium]
MFKGLKDGIVNFYIKEKELDISMIKLLGTAGIMISLVGAVQAIFTSFDSKGLLINILAALASLGLMIFVHATRKYLAGYLITSIGIFMILFTWLFLETGGMGGSIPYFFAFGMIFTLLMYKGKLMYIMETIQTLFYVGVCVFSYFFPEYVKPFETPGKQFGDQLAGILFSAIGIGFIFLLYIRTYRKQQKLAEDSSQAKSILLANISHEIRTPINMLLGMNEMILRESENTQINEYAQNIDNAGHQLLFMVNQFLDLARIDMGKEELFEENFNSFKMIRSLGDFFGKEADRKSIEFVMDIDKKLPAFLYGDIQKISQILSNLLTNAVKYTSKGTIVLSVQNRGKDENGYNVIHFEVSDTGNGIPAKEQEKIFESFERADIIRNRSIEGTGLGLAISNKLANIMGSKIQVKSQYGVGSEFWFDVPLKTGKESEFFANSDGFFIAPEAKILAVDDNNMNLMVVKSLLKRTMVNLDTAESALACYEKYEKSNYDLVLMDYMMPEIDGIEAMEHLREMDKARNRTTPIIVLTADATPDKKELFFAKGFDDYLLKPTDTNLLEKALIKHLPERLVTRVKNESVTLLPEDVKGDYTDLLKKYDISLEMALKHLSGDVLQFSRISEYFIKNTPGTIEKIRKNIEEGDYENAAINIHAIKGNAGNVGGEDLYYSARRLEKRAKDKDEKYVVSALPLFVMKWERVDEGLKEFLKEFEKLKPKIVPEKKEVKKILDEHTTWENLLSAVQLGNQSPALKLTDELALMYKDKETLEKIRGFIKNIEFDKAEELIKEVKV